MRKETVQFTVGSRLSSGRPSDAKERGAVPLEHVLAKRAPSEIQRDLKARSLKTFGR